MTKCVDIKKSALADGETEQSRILPETRFDWLESFSHPFFRGLATPFRS